MCRAAPGESTAVCYLHEADIGVSYTGPSDLRDRPELGFFECNSAPTSMVLQPKPFKVGFVPRDGGRLERWVGESFENTACLK